MKKVLLAFLGLLILSLALIYIFIPGQIRITETFSINISKDAVYRNVSDGRKWTDWWPGVKEKVNETPTFSLNGISFTLDDIKIASLSIQMNDGDGMTGSQMDFIPVRADSTLITWGTIVRTSLDPFKRVSQYTRAKRMAKNLRTILGSIRDFYSTNINIYGYDIRQESVKDSFLVSTYQAGYGYPSTGYIYELIDVLKDYIRTQGAVEKGYPMLNISTEDNREYLTRVAIPVDRMLQSSGKISYKWMLGGGNILVADVKGGKPAIDKAFSAMGLYVRDHQRVAPAIPFVSLITNRRSEPDSNKWLNRIYFPVM